MTDEPAELVVKWIAELGVTHPVVILKDRALEKVIGVDGFPTSAVFLNKEMQWKGHPSSAGSPLSAAHKGARQDGVYPKKLSKVVKSWNKGDKVKALSDLYKTMPKLEAADLDWAGRLDTFMKGESAKAFEASAQALEAGYWLRGVQLAQPYLGKGSEYPRVAETQAHLAMMQEKPGYSKEIKGGELFQEAKDLASSREYLDAFKTYKKVMKKAADTAIAGHAEAAARELMEGNKPGFKSSCSNCNHKTDAACAKHRVKVKL